MIALPETTTVTTAGAGPSVLTCSAARIAHAIDQHFPPEEAAHRQVIALAEEAGEFAGAYRRYRGMARRSGTIEEMASELADVVITAFVTAVVLNIDLDGHIERKLQIIVTRGWRDR
jgi:NTP pyrophosphatase (non-canonical NTP hydrolase)